MALRKLISVIACAIAVAGYMIYTLAGNNSLDIKIKTDEWKKAENIPSGLFESKKEGLAPGKYVNVYVRHVVDGDTIKVTYKKEDYNVRLLCIDTPESVKQGVDIQPFAKEASKETEKLLSGKQVKLVFEKGLRDKYGRLLAYVFLENGDFVNALLVSNGFARVEIVAPNSIYKDYFYKLQEIAINDKAGLWGLPTGQQPFVRDENGEYIPRYWTTEKAS
jgi:micrococcal nuclease